MTWTYSAGSGTDRDTVRDLIPDTDTANQLLSDEQIATYLRLHSNNVLRAAAMALEVVASNQALVLKVGSIGDVSTNGKAVADALRETAKLYRAQADLIEATEDDGAFDIAEQVFDQFSLEDRLLKQVDRLGA